jgi:hypothetical protein
MTSLDNSEINEQSELEVDAANQPLSKCIRCRSPYTALEHEWDLDPLHPALLRSTVYYLSNDPIFQREKPYFMNVPVDPKWAPQVKQTNVCYTQKVVDITDIRGHEEHFALDQQGFALRTLESALAYEDFESTDMITTRFYNEVKNFILAETKAAEVLPFDFQVSSRIMT